MYIVGKLVKPKGIKGELKAEVITSFPEHFSQLKELFIKDVDYVQLTIESVKFRNEFIYIKFAGVNSREDAEKLRNNYLYIPEKELFPLNDDEFYYHQLVGLKIFSEKNVYIGELKEIESYSANDVFIVESETGEIILLPAVKKIIKKVDLEARKMTIEVIEGLLN